LIRLEASRQGIKLPACGAAVLAGLDYGRETALKNQALQRFWKHHELPGRPEGLVVSPRPRHYRTTSKRRCRTWAKAGGQGQKNAPMRIYIADEGSELLEPREHAVIFAALEGQLSGTAFLPLARAMNFIIIRGSYEEFMVIFNLQKLDRDLNRLLLKAVERLRNLEVNVVAAFLFLDPGRSPYYLENDRPRGAFPIKKLFGPERFRLRLGADVFAIPPTSFSQVNESILPLLLEKVLAMTAGEARERLLDLYCGYGLFAISLRGRYREIIAVDAADGSIRAGHDMLSRLQGGARIHFRTAAINRDSLARALPPPLHRAAGVEDVILDPPRRGADGAVIRSIARRRPGRVLHLFCASEEIPGALAHWRQCGYHVRRVAALDMFPGTPQLETLVLLSPA
jgi:tRNA/tmRNA/rRNA uracil-C5-methylase (TrmA/RlmC/RlmD family)